MLERLQNGESIPLSEFTSGYDPISKLILESGGILPFAKRLKSGEIILPENVCGSRPMNMIEKMIASKLLGGADEPKFVKPGDAVLAQVLSLIHI